MSKHQREYTDDFKYRAVELSKEIGVAPAERKLGIPTGNIHNWRKRLEKLGRISKSDTKSPTETPEEELKRLRKENSDLKKANLILKHAAAFFSQDHLK